MTFCDTSGDIFFVVVIQLVERHDDAGEHVQGVPGDTLIEPRGQNHGRNSTGFVVRIGDVADQLFAASDRVLAAIDQFDGALALAQSAACVTELQQRPVRVAVASPSFEELSATGEIPSGEAAHARCGQRGSLRRPRGVPE